MMAKYEELTVRQFRANVSEREFGDAVIELAKLCGWRVHHTRPARTSKGWVTPIQGDAGFPDLALLKGEWLWLAELKADKGKLSDGQENWYRDLLEVREVRADIWRPTRDWPRIEQILRG